jgi:hypothetical protein
MVSVTLSCAAIHALFAQEVEQKSAQSCCWFARKADRMALEYTRSYSPTTLAPTSPQQALIKDHVSHLGRRFSWLSVGAAQTLPVLYRSSYSALDKARQSAARSELALPFPVIPN